MPLSATRAMPHSGDKESERPNHEAQGDANAGRSADEEGEGACDRETHGVEQQRIMVDVEAEGGVPDE